VGKNHRADAEIKVGNPIARRGKKISARTAADKMKRPPQMRRPSR
jgi:hypothetical protein